MRKGLKGVRCTATVPIFGPHFAEAENLVLELVVM